jgi:hypothetical protein
VSRRTPTYILLTLVFVVIGEVAWLATPVAAIQHGKKCPNAGTSCDNVNCSGLFTECYRCLGTQKSCGVDASPDECCKTVKSGSACGEQWKGVCWFGTCTNALLTTNDCPGEVCVSGCN